MNKIACVTFGDESVGLRSLLITYTTNAFPAEYVPTVWDNGEYETTLDGKDVSLSLISMAGQQEYSRLRPLAYEMADIFLLGFSIGSPSSLTSLQIVWVPEIRKLCPNTPIVIVGLKKDLRDNPDTVKLLKQKNLKPIPFSYGVKMAQQLGAAKYIECSALKQEGVKEVFEEVIRAFRAHQSRKNKCIIS
ncbi:ras-related C3 botulinum toxin substrate 1-like [Diabrotica virgifera virgifera]|uniref:Uncharacterized protein n=1 Tax=Diabrotica virgifera virgifera TaxID=50390 RepID=A0ABM5K1L8_DIAVI|nr:ras-related C3 botulinum toxin substrate 1-like [Diabrotica virgifera virgifera]